VQKSINAFPALLRPSSPLTKFNPGENHGPEMQANGRPLIERQKDK
jgi:hypothetical protein